MRHWFHRHRRLLQSAEVIHVSNTHTLEFLWRMAGRWLDRRRVFLTRHGMSFRFPVPERERQRARRSLKLASGFVHDGLFIEKWLNVHADLCPNQGLSPPADELQPVPEPSPNSAVFIGRLEPDSGLDLYLDAIGILQRSFNHPFQLEVYGDGSLMSSMRQRVERESIQVSFHGSKSDGQNYLTHGSFAFVSGRMTMQEAMARRRLVIAAYMHPLKRDYIVGEPFGGHVVAAGSGEEIARQVAYYLHHPEERANRISRAFEYARTLRWERTAHAYLEFWEQRLAQTRPQMGILQRLQLRVALELEAHRRSDYPLRTIPHFPGSSPQPAPTG